MATAVRNALDMLGVDLAAGLRMASRYPAAFLGLDHELGRIAPGYRANLVLVDEGINVLETWIGGKPATLQDAPRTSRMLPDHSPIQGEHGSTGNGRGA